MKRIIHPSVGFLAEMNKHIIGFSLIVSSFCLTSALAQTPNSGGLNVPPGPVGFGQSIEAPHVATNALLAAASTVTYPNGVQRDDYAAGNGAPPLWYEPSASPCSLNSGAGDNGSQVASADGKCWLARFPSNGADAREWGVSTANSDNSAQLQAAINAMQGGTIVVYGGPYKYSTALISSGTIAIEGNSAPATAYSSSCTVGLRTTTSNIVALTLDGPGSIIKDLCLDSNASNTSGTGIYVAYGASESRLEENAIFNMCWGIDVTGNGGSQNIGTVLEYNSIVSTISGCGGIRIGVASTGASTGDVRLVGNGVGCNNNNSTALEVLDSGGLLATANTFGYECNIGTYFYPGVNQSIIWSSFTNGPNGDTSNTYDLLIDTADSSAKMFGNRFTGAWTSAGATAGVLIQNTAGAVYESGFDFVQQQIYLNATTNATGFDFKSGNNIRVRDSIICPGAASSGIGIIVEGTASDVSITNNRIGRCGDGTGSGNLATGISVTTSSFVIGVIEGNDLYYTTTPIYWSPSGGVNNLHAVVDHNAGVDDVQPNVTSATTITAPINPLFFLTGSTTPVLTINGGWQGRQIQVAVTSNATTLGGSGGNVCNAIALSTYGLATLTYNAGLACWMHQ